MSKKQKRELTALLKGDKVVAAPGKISGPCPLQPPYSARFAPPAGAGCARVCLRLRNQQAFRAPENHSQFRRFSI